MRRRLRLPPRAGDQTPMNMVVRTEDGAVSLLVDEIGDVLDVDSATYERPPENLTSRRRVELIRGVYKLKDRLLLVLDAERTVHSSPQGERRSGQIRRMQGGVDGAPSGPSARDALVALLLVPSTLASNRESAARPTPIRTTTRCCRKFERRFAPECTRFHRIPKASIICCATGTPSRWAYVHSKVIHTPGHSSDSICLYEG